MSDHFNEGDIKHRIEDIFIEGKRIEVVFNMESMAPIVHATEIFKCNHENAVLLLFQTRPKILPNFQYKSMDIAILLTGELNRKFRMGLPCRIVKFINNYKVSERVIEDFLLVAYSPPLRKINLRSTFRLRTGYRYVVGGAFNVNNTRYVSEKDFKVHDISVTGIGMLVPKRIGKKDNPLLNLDTGIEFEIQLRLKDAASQDSEFKISTCVKIARKMISYNVKSGFLGLKFSGLDPIEQEKLFQYIHDAQLYEIRSLKNV